MNPKLTVEFHYRLVQYLAYESWEIWAKFKDGDEVIHDIFAPFGDPSKAVIHWMENRVCDWA